MLLEVLLEFVSFVKRNNITKKSLAIDCNVVRLFYRSSSFMQGLCVGVLSFFNEYRYIVWKHIL